MNYKKHYDLLIERGKDRMLEGYVEKHHIVPRCLGGSDAIENLVQLTPEEHYLAHQLLVKMYPDNFGLLSSAMYMTGGNKNRKTNKTYGWLKRRYSNYMKGPNNPQKINPIKGDRHWAYGKSFDKSHFTEEGLEAIAVAKRGEKNPMYGIKPWNHGRATKYTKDVWARADKIYDLWKENSDPAANRLYRLDTKKIYDWKTDKKMICPYMNLVKYFRKDWKPYEDEEWKTFMKDHKL
jgi:hypothetical protein